MTARTLLVLGGTSDIGLAIAREYAAHGWDIVLTARNPDDAARNAADVQTRSGRAVRVLPFDVLSAASRDELLTNLEPLPDTVICVVGVLGDQARGESDPAHASEIIRANFEGPALILDALAARMITRGNGTLVGISSVAGVRGRGSNYLYGSAKAGFSAFLSGLRNRLAPKGVHVLTVLPGFVRTRMTEGLKLPPPITADPAEVGRAVFRAAEISRRNVIYVRAVWRLIMAIITAIPERIFKTLKL